MTEINVADVTAAAYGRKPPRYPVIPETLGLALVLLMNRNTAPERGLWLTDQQVSDAVCGPAEAFAKTLTGRKAPRGWRGGALASLRTLAGGALHETAERWPHSREGAVDLVPRLWVEDGGDRWDEKRPAPFRADVLARVAAVARRAPGDPVAAWQALCGEFFRDPTYSERQRGRGKHWGALCAWSSSYERPHKSRDLEAQLAGRDPYAEREARFQEQAARYATHQEARP